jgi:4-hydroxy-2-oxoheptanedioate aldolase
MRTSRIRAKLARNEPALCTTLTLADPVVFELTSLMGFDGIWLDLGIGPK